MDAFEAIMTRRSTRSYTDEAVDPVQLEKIIDAGRYAPSGGNSQTTHFLVLTNPEVLQKLAEIVETEFAKMEIREDMYVSMRGSIAAAKKGGYMFYYGAPVLIVVANRKGYGNAMADSACALENMMIAANALNLGSCWINQLHWLDENKVVRVFLERLGLAENETITGGLILGYPEGDTLNREALPRVGNPVTWVE